MRVGVAQMLGAVLTDDVVRWRGDLRESGHPSLGITDTTEGREREPGWARHGWFVAGRKDLHICQKHQWAARIPARRKIRRPPAINPAPHGDVYTWYQRGLELLGRGSAAAAAQLLERAAAAEPGSRSVLEALGRAQFDTRRYDGRRAHLPADRGGQPDRRLRPVRPRPGAGPGRRPAAPRPSTSRWPRRCGPELRHYTDALRGVRATLRARSKAAAETQPGGPDETKGIV